MSRRSTPERLSNARRSALVNRLAGELRWLPARAEAEVAAWEARTAQDGRARGGADWDAAWRALTTDLNDPPVA